MRPLIAGNWKLHGHRVDLQKVELVAAWAQKVRPAIDVLLCPPATLIVEANARGGRAARNRRTRLRFRRLGRAYRRHRRGDAEGRQGERRAGRPFRAPAKPWRDRCACVGESCSGAACRLVGDRVLRPHTKSPNPSSGLASPAIRRLRKSALACPSGSAQSEGLRLRFEDLFLGGSGRANSSTAQPMFCAETIHRDEPKGAVSKFRGCKTSPRGRRCVSDAEKTGRKTRSSAHMIS